MNNPAKPNINKPNKASNCPKVKSNLNNAKYKAIIVGNMNNTNNKMLIIILVLFSIKYLIFTPWLYSVYNT